MKKENITLEDTPNSHYDAGGMSFIDIARAKLTPEQYSGFLLGNIIKYSTRLNFKGQSGKDAAKLAEYSAWLDEHYALRGVNRDSARTWP